MQLIISIVTPFDFPRQVEYSCVISLSAASLPRTITRRTRRHATTPNATAKSSSTVFMRRRRRARTSDLMLRSPPPRWDTILDRIASGRCQPRAGLEGTELARISQRVMRTSSTDLCRFRGMGVTEYSVGIAGLVRFEPRELHDLRPLLGFLGDKFPE